MFFKIIFALFWLLWCIAAIKKARENKLQAFAYYFWFVIGVVFLIAIAISCIS